LSHNTINFAHTHSIANTPTTTSTTYKPTGTLSGTAPTITDNRTWKYDKTTSATFAGTTATLSHTSTSFAHTHGIPSSTVTLSINYTPAGTLSANTVDVAGAITGTFYGSTAEYTVTSGTITTTATSTFYGKAIAAHSHSFTSTTTSGQDSTTL